MYNCELFADIQCDSNALCNKAKWADSSWEDGNVPGIISHGALLKDSVIVPAGGYVVIRFLADNPGLSFDTSATKLKCF